MRPETKHICDIREGWASRFFGSNLLVAKDGRMFSYPLKDIKQGELLPREEDIK